MTRNAKREVRLRGRKGRTKRKVESRERRRRKLKLLTKMAAEN